MSPIKGEGNISIGEVNLPPWKLSCLIISEICPRPSFSSIHLPLVPTPDMCTVDIDGYVIPLSIKTIFPALLAYLNHANEVTGKSLHCSDVV